MDNVTLFFNTAAIVLFCAPCFVVAAVALKVLFFGETIGV